MSKPIVAIVGRPNVGKSMLFNKLIGQRLSIVEDTPGVTRDRIYGECEWCGRKFTLVDTGGIEPRTDSQILTFMREQAQIAIENATVIIFLTDIKTGLTASDQEVANMLLRSRKPIVLAVNKMDSVGAPNPDYYEFYNLGLGDPVAVSAVHGHGTGDLLDACVAYFPDEEEAEEESDVLKVAIIGKPNVGKSSLTNRILGQERVIVSTVAGTTRDAIDSYFENETGKYVFIDTAGMRKKSRIEESIEKYSVLRATMAIDRADVCGACTRGGQGLHHRGQQVGPCREGRQDHGQDARGHPPRSELYDLRAHPVHLGGDRSARAAALRAHQLRSLAGLHPHHHGNAQQRSRGRADARPAAHGQGQAPEDLLHDAGGRVPSSLRHLLQ